MIVSGLVLFLFGTAVSAGPFLPPAPTDIIISKNRHASSNHVNEYYPASGKSPFISNFIQKGTNVFFKPQFVLAAAQMPPPVQAMIAEIEKDDCKTAYPMGPVPLMPIIEEPLRVIEKEIIAAPEIKEVIEINPMPHPTVLLPQGPVLVEEPCEVERVVVPQAPLLPEAVYVPEVVVPVSKAPLVIPAAPVLPPLEMPKMPVMVEKVPLVEPFPEVPMIVEVERAEEIAIIPPAPVLPPMEMPKVPMIVEEPCAPVEVIKEAELKPVVIPEAPLLPAIIPESYIREVIVEEKPVVLPAPAIPSQVVEIVEPFHPIVIPEAPVLPPMESMALPAPVVVEEVRPVSFELEKEIVVPAVIPPAPVVHPMVIPEAPVLAPMEPMALPAPVVVEEVRPISFEIEKEIVVPAVIPPAPVLPPMEIQKAVVEKEMVNAVVPVPCETVEVIEEHIQPMVIPEAPLLPPMAPLGIPAPVIVEKPVTFEIEKEVLAPVVIPPAPVLAPLEMPELPKVVVAEPCETVEIIEEHVKPMLIPDAPLLAPLAVPTPIIVERPVSVEIEKEILKPVVLPPAPVLPPLMVPKVPVMVEKPAEVVVAPCPPENEVVIEQRPIMTIPFEYSELSLSKPIVVPAPPMVPPFRLPYKPSIVREDSVMVEKNELLSFPVACADDIVVERILPKMEMALKTNKAPVPYHFVPLGNVVL